MTPFEKSVALALAASPLPTRFSGSVVRRAGLHVDPDASNRKRTSFGSSHRRRCVIVAVRADGCFASQCTAELAGPGLGDDGCSCGVGVVFEGLMGNHLGAKQRAPNKVSGARCSHG